MPSKGPINLPQTTQPTPIPDRLPAHCERGSSLLSPVGAQVPRVEDCKSLLERVVFSLTTIPARIEYIKPVLDAVVSEQTRPPDAVYLSLGPDITALPKWLESYDERSSVKGVLRVLRHAHDPGPGLKLLGGLQAELAAGHRGALVIYGDDDIVYGRDIIRLHSQLQHDHCVTSGGRPTALGPRKISGGSENPIPVLEAGGTISVPAASVPCAAFAIGTAPEPCKFSDDYFLARALGGDGVELRHLEECHMDWSTGSMHTRCLRDRLPHVEAIGALSRMTLHVNGSVRDRSSGDWRTQLRRYALCEELLKNKVL